MTASPLSKVTSSSAETSLPANEERGESGAVNERRRGEALRMRGVEQARAVQERGRAHPCRRAAAAR